MVSCGNVPPFESHVAPDIPPVPALQQDDEDSAGERNKNSSKSRKHRIIFNTAQLKALEVLYQQQPYPDQDLRAKIADRLDLDEDRITVWFQNRRAKHKREIRNETHGQRKNARKKAKNTSSVSESPNQNVANIHVSFVSSPGSPADSLPPNGPMGVEYSTWVNVNHTPVPQQTVIRSAECNMTNRVLPSSRYGHVVNGSTLGPQTDPCGHPNVNHFDDPYRSNQANMNVRKHVSHSQRNPFGQKENAIGSTLNMDSAQYSASPSSLATSPGYSSHGNEFLAIPPPNSCATDAKVIPQKSLQMHQTVCFPQVVQYSEFRPNRVHNYSSIYHSNDLGHLTKPPHEHDPRRYGSAFPQGINLGQTLASFPLAKADDFHLTHKSSAPPEILKNNRENTQNSERVHPKIETAKRPRYSGSSSDTESTTPLPKRQRKFRKRKKKLERESSIRKETGVSPASGKCNNHNNSRKLSQIKTLAKAISSPEPQDTSLSSTYESSSTIFSSTSDSDFEVPYVKSKPKLRTMNVESRPGAAVSRKDENILIAPSGTSDTHFITKMSPLKDPHESDFPSDFESTPLYDFLFGPRTPRSTADEGSDKTNTKDSERGKNLKGRASTSKTSENGQILSESFSLAQVCSPATPGTLSSFSSFSPFSVSSKSPSEPSEQSKQGVCEDASMPSSGSRKYTLHYGTRPPLEQRQEIIPRPRGVIRPIPKKVVPNAQIYANNPSQISNFNSSYASHLNNFRSCATNNPAQDVRRPVREPCPMNGAPPNQVCTAVPDAISPIDLLAKYLYWTGNNLEQSGGSMIT